MVSLINRIKKMFEAFAKNFVVIFGYLICILSIYYFFSIFEITRKMPEAKEMKDVKELRGSIQNHLVWTIRNECYFVRPYSYEVFYLIRVEDCDRK